MPTGDRPDPDGADSPEPSATDRALHRMLEQWQREDPEGFARLMRQADGLEQEAVDTEEPARAYRQGDSMRVRRPRTRVWVLLAALVWLRRRLPAVRPELFMEVGWVVLLPAVLVQDLVVAVVVAGRG